MENNKVMTPEDFEQKMKEIKYNPENYLDDTHRDMDVLMCEVLKSLGYEKGVEIFLETDKWYA